MVKWWKKWTRDSLYQLKCVLIVRPKIPQMSQNLSSSFFCPTCLSKPKCSGFQWKKGLRWASLVRGFLYDILFTKNSCQKWGEKWLQCENACTTCITKPLAIGSFSKLAGSISPYGWWSLYFMAYFVWVIFKTIFWRLWFCNTG
jgi:hypothetical protein